MLVAVMALCVAVPWDIPAYPGYQDTLKRVNSASGPMPVVLFVACPPRDIPGALICQEYSFEECTEPTIVVGVPIPGKDYLARFDLPATATDRRIMNLFKKYQPKPPEVVPPPPQLQSVPVPSRNEWRRVAPNVGTVYAVPALQDNC